MAKFQPSSVAILGATSGIAQSFIRQSATRTSEFYLVARNETRLQAVADDARTRGCEKVNTLAADVLAEDFHQRALGFLNLGAHFPEFILIAWGELSPTNEDAAPEEIKRCWDVNVTSVIVLLEALKPLLKEKPGTRLAVLTSVAGDRGRASSGIYGPAKGGLSTYLQAYRQEMGRFEVGVTDIRPGFVDTAMTAHLEKGKLFSSPDKIAAIIERGARRNQAVVYAPWYWRWIMLIIRLLPDFIYKRLKF